LAEALQRLLVDGNDDYGRRAAFSGKELLIAVEQGVAQSEDERRLDGEQNEECDQQRQGGTPP
jgi:hypothetical protein